MNKTSSYSYTVKKIIKLIMGGKMNFDFPIQRDSGQWSKQQKCLFIHSIIQGYDVPDIYVIDDGTDLYEKSSVLDGKQRCTTLKEFYIDELRLSKDLQPIELDGKQYTISGKKFSQLPEELQEEFLDYSIRARKMNGFTDEQIEEQFYRLNNGSTFTVAQKANIKLGNDLADKISEIANSNFFNLKSAFSSRQRKSAETISCVLQTMMLLTGFDYKHMSNSEVFRYAKYLNDQYDNGTFNISELEYCKHLFDRLYTLIPDDIDTSKILKKVHIPSLIMNFEKMESMEEDGDITEDIYKLFLKYWFTDGMKKENYTGTCGQGATQKSKTENRISVLENELLQFIQDITITEDQLTFCDVDNINNIIEKENHYERKESSSNGSEGTGHIIGGVHCEERAENREIKENDSRYSDKSIEN